MHMYFLHVDAYAKMDCLTGLNTFNYLALISQFLTCFGAIVILIKEYVEQISEDGQDVTSIWILQVMILFLNAAAALVYPIYCLLRAWADNREIDTDPSTGSFAKCLSSVLGKEQTGWFLSKCGFDFPTVCTVKRQPTKILDNGREMAQGAAHQQAEPKTLTGTTGFATPVVNSSFAYNLDRHDDNRMDVNSGVYFSSVHRPPLRELSRPTYSTSQNLSTTQLPSNVFLGDSTASNLPAP